MDRVSRRGVSAAPRAMTVSAMQTIDEESLPPLSSARTGLSERSLRWTAFAKTVRKCSSYSASVRWRIFVPGSKSQYLLTAVLPGSEQHERGRWNGMNSDVGR